MIPAANAKGNAMRTIPGSKLPEAAMSAQVVRFIINVRHAVKQRQAHMGLQHNIIRMQDVQHAMLVHGIRIVREQGRMYGMGIIIFCAAFVDV